MTGAEDLNRVFLREHCRACGGVGVVVCKKGCSAAGSGNHHHVCPECRNFVVRGLHSPESAIGLYDDHPAEAQVAALEKQLSDVLKEWGEAKEENKRLREQKDSAYAERDQLVALLARIAPWMGWGSGVGRHSDEDKSWDNDWRTIVFVDLPTGQASWHIHDSESRLVAGLPRYLKPWDGHSTPEKYRRVEECLSAPCLMADHECPGCGRIAQPCTKCAPTPEDGKAASDV